MAERRENGNTSDPGEGFGGSRRWPCGLMRLVAMTVAGALGLVLMTTTPVSAAVEPEPAPVVGPIRAAHSGLCLGVAGGSTEAGAEVVQLTCDDSASQTWTITDLGGGYRRLQVGHTGHCLDIFGGSLEPLTTAIQWPCTGGQNQQFAVDADPAATRLVARHSGLCLDIEGGSTVSGADAIQFGCGPQANQRFALATDAGDGSRGRWSAPTSLPLVPVAGSALGNGKVLLWSAYERFTFGGDRGYTQTLLYDPDTGQVSQRQVSNTGHDMFCPGIANLADGRILVNGGSSAAETSIYDPVSDSWQDAADMNIPRGYQGTTLLSDGSVFTVGGSWSGGQGNKHAEVWTEAGGWRRLTGVRAEPFTADDPQGVYRGDNHLWLFAWTGGRVFHAGPTRAMHWVDTSGSGSVSGAGNRGQDGYAMNGNAVMYEPGKILTVGGAPAYQDVAATANATVIDLNGPTVTSRAVAPMANRRGFHNSVVLPSGEVVVVGGQTRPVPFTDTGAVLAAELWDPQTETFRTLAPMAIPRTYHSMAVLLADGRVLVGGGGLCGSCSTNHPDIEILTPPYLLDDQGQAATRPTISSAPPSIDLAQRFEVSASAGISEFSLVRMASATHSVNNDQRRVPLAFADLGGGSYRLTAPADAGVAPPGDYYLFAIDAAGVPSVAAVVNLTTTVDPGDDPGSITGTVSDEGGDPVGGVAVDLFAQAADGSRGAWLAQTTTTADGSYRFDVDPGCYVLTFIAPTGRTFVGSGQWLQSPLCVESGQAVTGQDATLTGGGPDPGDTAIGGAVDDGDGPVAGVAIDLFTANADGSRGSWLAQTTTTADGSYRFDVDPGCYVLTFIAPAGRTFTNGSPWFQPGQCVDDGQTITALDATLSGGGAGGTAIGGSVDDGDGPVAGVAIDLFTANADGTRGTWLRQITTGADGGYRFDVDPGCYVLTFIAPAGRTFTNGSRWFQPGRCLDEGQAITTLDATLS